MKITKSFGFAIKGILYCLKNERNMRIHLVISVYVLVFSFFFKLTFEKYMILLLTVSSVLASELINTAIEGLLDLVVSDYNTVIKTIKDIVAGAVLVTAVFSVIIGSIVFSDLGSYIKICNFFVDFPMLFVLLLISLVASYFYINNRSFLRK